MSPTSTRHDGKLAPPPSGPPGPGASGRKRKHDEHAATEDLLKHPVVVKPHPPKLSVRPRSLQPLMVLPREWLPLSCLDLALPYGAFEHARFFESAIRVLELEGRMGARPVILIARLETDQTVYALERQGSQRYSLCKLGNWVDLEQLSHHATVAYTKLIKPRVDLSAQSKDPLPLTTPQLHRETKSRRVAIEAIQSLVKRPARSPAVALGSQLQETPLTQTLSQTEPASIQPSSSATERVSSQLDAVPASDTRPDQSPAGTILEIIRNQYCETLYHTMGSLAYFAKGPLSRARAACPMDPDANPNMNNLIEFLKGLILTTVQIDKKYREAVPAIIGKMNTHPVDSGDEPASKTKQRKTKKMKLGKDGLYPREEEDVRKWWAAHKPRHKNEEHVATTALSQETKLHISCLRTRETQLQMILVLEILALESLKQPGLPNDAPAAPGHGATPEASKQPPAKKRNKHNLPMLLDVHADRLSIWQTTALDEIKMLEDSQAGQSNDANKTERSGSDPLRDFCIDIIVPFFSARLPGHCSALNRKLGGPVMPSPPKTKPKRPEPAVKSKSQPGAVKRSGAPKQTRTLERVLSKETERHRRSISRGPSGVIALMRSASTPTLPVVKREASESAPPSNAPRPDSKDSNHVSFIGATRTPAGEKAKKEVQVQAELHDAISGLRKPNREVVGKAMAEAEERRATTSLSQLRKSKKPTQHTGSQNVVKATPAGPRFRDVFAREAPGQSITNSSAPTKVEADRVPPPWSMVPSSTPRKRDRETAFLIDESPALPRSFKLPPEQIAATPVRTSAPRQPNLLAPASDDGVVLASSPVPTKRTQSLGGLPGSLRIRDSGIDMPSSPSDGQSMASAAKKPCVGRVGSLEGFVTVTPVKKRTADRAAITPIKHDAAKASGSKQLSIYNQLGWDEYDELF